MRTMRKHVATGQKIKRILGPVDDETATAIAKIGATAAEVEGAFEWLNDDDYRGAKLGKPMGARVRRVYDILQGERDYMSREER